MQKRQPIPHPHDPLLSLIPLGGKNGGFTVIELRDAGAAAGHNWFGRKASDKETVYAYTGSSRPDGSFLLLSLHRLIAERMGIVGPPDHIDGDGLNNRRSNLRADPNHLNQANRDRQRNNTSGFKGVSWNKTCSKWQVTIGICGKSIYLGLFDSPISAAMAYDRAAVQYHGEFAFLNFRIDLRTIAIINNSFRSTRPDNNHINQE